SPSGGAPSTHDHLAGVHVGQAAQPDVTVPVCQAGQPDLLPGRSILKTGHESPTMDVQGRTYPPRSSQGCRLPETQPADDGQTDATPLRECNHDQHHAPRSRIGAAPTTGLVRSPTLGDLRGSGAGPRLESERGPINGRRAGGDSLETEGRL